jgi:polar amino acid transport system substrate-binding protein
MFRLVLFSLVGCLWLSAACADALLDIRTRGELVVGTKIDYPPYGFQDASALIVGFEPELAADLAKRLGVRLRLVPVTSANRIEMLQGGKVDLIIATLSVTSERRRQAGIVDPPYYASGAGVMFRHDLHIAETSDLAGKLVCAVDGNIFLTELRARSVSLSVSVQKDAQSAQSALLAGHCEVLFFDDSPLFYLKMSQPTVFKDFDVGQLIEIDPLLWGVAVRKGEEVASLGHFVGQVIVEWHRSGFLLDAEKKWLGGNTILLKALQQKWTESGSRQ